MRRWHAPGVAGCLAVLPPISDMTLGLPTAQTQNEDTAGSVQYRDFPVLTFSRPRDVLTGRQIVYPDAHTVPSPRSCMACRAIMTGIGHLSPRASTRFPSLT